MKYLHIVILIWALYACKPKVEKDTGEQVLYTCSMDPQIMEPKPGTCPICKMALTKVVVDQNEKPNSLKISKEQETHAHIKTIRATFDDIGKELVLNGQLSINENKRNTISSPVAGRIEHLYIKNTGTPISAGTLLYEIYSEELLMAQQEYLMALEKSKEQISPSNTQYLLDAAQNKLLLWGMSPSQIKGLNKATAGSVKIYSQDKGTVSTINISEGSYVMEGMTLFQTVDLSTLWVEAQLYANEMHEFSNAEEVRIKVEGFPEQEWKSKITFVAPQLEAQSKINIIRAEIQNTNLLLKPGMQASIWLQQKSKKALIIPLNALLQDSKGATVWIHKGDRYESRTVTTGIENNDKVEILTGISEGDEVVVSGAYLLHSEYVFRKGMC